MKLANLLRYGSAPRWRKPALNFCAASLMLAAKSTGEAMVARPSRPALDVSSALPCPIQRPNCVPPSPGCSIVMPVFNAGPYIEEAIQSVLQQSTPNWELMIIDDGSWDDSAKLARQFDDPRVTVIEQAHAGVGAARNRGIAESCCDFIMFVDADDRLRPDAIERLCVALDRNPGASVAYGESVAMDHRGTISGSTSGPLLAQRPTGRVLPQLLQCNFVVVGAVCIRAARLAQLGGFRTDLRLGEDWELWCRLALSDRFVYVGEQPLVDYRFHSHSTVVTLGRTATELLRSIHAIFTHPAIQRSFDGDDLCRLRQRAEASAYALSGTKCLKLRDWSQARWLFLQCLGHDWRRPREAILLAVSLLSWLPDCIERRLK